MHYMRNGPKSQLWLFQFHECYFFIKAQGGRVDKILLLAKKETTKVVALLLSASHIIKNGMEQAWQPGQHVFAL